MTLPRLFFSLLILTLTNTVQATMYKCQLPGGGTTFQEFPCTNGVQNEIKPLANESTRSIEQVINDRIRNLEARYRARGRRLPASKRAAIRKEAILAARERERYKEARLNRRLERAAAADESGQTAEKIRYLQNCRSHIIRCDLDTIALALDGLTARWTREALGNDVHWRKFKRRRYNRSAYYYLFDVVDRQGRVKPMPLQITINGVVTKVVRDFER